MPQLAFFPYQLWYKHPFRIAHTVREYTDVLYLQFFDETTEGWGEAVFPPYVSEKVDSSIAFLQKMTFPDFTKEADVFDFLENFIAIYKESRPAICAGLEMAILRYWSKKTNQPLEKVLNTEVVHKETSVTLSISSKEVLQQKLLENQDANYFKLKVDENSIEEMIENYTANCSKPFVVDANQGFQSKEKALFWSQKMKELGVAYFEQPFHKEDLASHQWLTKQQILPIIADESFQHIGNIDEILQSFDGVNIKLMKCGGFLEAQKIVQICQKSNKKVVVGCMSDSSVAIQMAMLLSKEVDFLDLDGPLLMKNDPVLHHHIDFSKQGQFKKLLS